MAAYESDSSDAEFIETSVLLGYTSKDAEDETISKLGGRPDWLNADKPPSAALARCKGCSHLMTLILQLNAELPEKFPGHDRRLYVFACKRQSCRRKNGSVRALRGVRARGSEGVPVKQEQDVTAERDDTKQKEDRPGLGDALFKGAGLGGGISPADGHPFLSSANPFLINGGSSNPFSASTVANPFSSQPQPQHLPNAAKGEAAEDSKSCEQLDKSFAETLSLNTLPAAGPPSPPETWPDVSSQPEPFRTLYLAEADYETLEPMPNKIPENARIEDADAPETVSALDKEAFESSMDATFQRFADRLAQNPEQVIRYEFAGTPLLYSKTDAVGDKLSKGSVPDCANCGGRRTFEVQLTPNAIAELEADHMSLDGMEWGTIIVAVCEKDCVPRHVGKDESGYLEEWAGVQWEELSKQT